MSLAKEPIWKEELERKLVRAAMVRTAVTMLSALPLVVLAALASWLGGGTFGFGVVYFGGGLLVMKMMTEYYCRPAVTCPHCGHSLWDCGTGNFKPRRMRIRPDAEECPGCHTPIL